MSKNLFVRIFSRRIVIFFGADEYKSSRHKQEYITIYRNRKVLVRGAQKMVRLVDWVAVIKVHDRCKGKRQAIFR